MKNIYPYFSQNPLDRLDLIRRDKKLFEELKNSNKSQFVLFDGSNIIVNEIKKECFFSNKDLDTNQAILLGRYKNRDYFALSVKEPIANHLSKISLRDFANSDFITKNRLGIIAQGNAVLNWHEAHQYCSYCGEPTKIKHAGWRRDCATCKRQHFLRIDPVVIMLVTHENYCLVGRGVNFLKNRYSCLAGFMESGETIEDASRRELYEEAGVIGLKVQYKMSQPWPFPSTLMIGVHVKAKSKELHIDTHEIADAKWVHKDEIKAILNGDESFGFSLPTKIAIGRNLLEEWVSTFSPV